MTIKKIVKSGKNYYEVFFGQTYVGYLHKILPIINLWKELLTYYENSEDYNQKLRKLKSIVSASLFQFSKGTLEDEFNEYYQIITLIWYFYYREKGIAQNEICEHLFEAKRDNEHDIISLIIKPQSQQPEELIQLLESLDEEVQQNFIEPFTRSEKIFYNKCLKEYNDYLDFHNKFDVALDMLLKKLGVSNLKLFEKRIGSIEAKIEELSNEIRKIGNEVKKIEDEIKKS